ncbi:MAG: DUF1990 domain-containing protein [Deltaproteobacteria bacterium]|nr:DUF1990 domain-containing protein [Deltaproteobacteria bacterium]
MAEAKPTARGAQISVLKPSTRRIRTFVDRQRQLEFNYPSVGATRDLDASADGRMLGDYNVDAARVTVGRGSEAFARATEAIKRWKMFELGWVQLCWPDTRICTGSAVAILARVARGWLLNASRIAYTIEETGSRDRYGFGYGTLPGHLLRGEEKFMVTWDRESNQVDFELIAMSRPGQLFSWLSYPLVRRLQRRFRREACQAMQRAVQP